MSEIKIPYSDMSKLQGAKRSDFRFWGSPVLEINGELVCPGYTGPVYSKNDWEYFTINTPTPIKSPGICEVSVRKGRDVDVKKAAGGDNATLTVHGERAAEVEIAVRIWTPQQYKLLMDLWTLLFPPPSKGTEAAQQEATQNKKDKRPNNKPQAPPFQASPWIIDHPQLKTHRVSYVLFTDADGPSASRGGGERVFSMRGIEWFPPVQKSDAKKSATNTPKTAMIRGNQVARLHVTPGEDQENKNP